MDELTELRGAILRAALRGPGIVEVKRVMGSPESAGSPILSTPLSIRQGGVELLPAVVVIAGDEEFRGREAEDAVAALVDSRFLEPLDTSEGREQYLVTAAGKAAVTP